MYVYTLDTDPYKLIYTLDTKTPHPHTLHQDLYTHWIPEPVQASECPLCIQPLQALLNTWVMTNMWNTWCELWLQHVRSMRYSISQIFQISSIRHIKTKL